jgi:RNA recognition motif-containing protein
LCFDEGDKENIENLPDNSNMHCNLCVTGLDESVNSDDLHLMFARFGELKSCKVAKCSVTGKSKGYGFVWFTTEKSCASALSAKDIPYKVQLYKQICIRALE